MKRSRTPVRYFLLILLTLVFLPVSSVQSAVEDTEASVRSTFQKGRVAYENGDWGAALAEWSKIESQFPPSSQEAALFKKVRRDYETLKTAKTREAALAAQKKANVRTPGEFTEILKKAEASLQQQIKDTQTRQALIEKNTVFEQAWINTTFEKGKAAYEAGDYDRAIEEWEKLVFKMGRDSGEIHGNIRPDERSGMQAQLSGVKKASQTLQEAKRSSEQFVMAQYEGSKAPFTNELEKILINLDTKIQSDLTATQAERAKIEKAVTERQSWVNLTFEKGKAYYEAGKYNEAIQYWSALSPYLKDDPEVSALMVGLPQRLQSLAQAQKAVETAETQNAAALTPPADLPRLLDELTAKINALNMEMMSRAEKARQAGDGRALAMDRIFQQGKAAYAEGKWEEALKIWSALPPYVQDEARVKALVDNLSASYHNFASMRDAAQGAEARLSEKFPAPADLAAVLSDAAFKLDKERQTTELSRDRTEKIIAQKQAAVQKLYDEGKVFYDQGKLADAFAAWRSLAPSVRDEKEIMGLLTKADESYQMYISAKAQNQQVLAKNQMRVDSPAELGQMLETANQHLRDQIFDMKSSTSQTEKMLQDRKNWIDVTFQKGKLAYTQGRYQEAVGEWRTLLPFVENGTLLEQQLSDFERNLKVSLESSKTNAEAEQKKTAKFAPPDDLPILLVELNEKVKSEALQASTEKIRAEQLYSERQKWMKETFDLGKAFYLEGKFDQAVAEWEKFRPYLEERSGVQKLIEAVKQGHNEASVAKKAAVEAAAGDYQGLKLPYAGQITKLLTEADAKLKEEAAEYTAKKNEMAKTMSERQEWSITTFNKGKIFYDQGQIEEALDQWERLLPYLEEGAVIKERIQSLRENHNAIVAGKNSLRDPSSGETRVKLTNENQMLDILTTADQRFKDDVEAARMKRLELERSLEQRKAWIEDTFEKGRIYYDQGNYAEALEEWGILGPYLGEHPKVRDLIETAKKDYYEGRHMEQITAAMSARTPALSAIPPTQVQEAVPSQTQEEAEPSVEEPASGDPMELVSGEIVSIDEPEHTVTLQLFNEDGTEETLTVNFDERTQVDGADSKSLSDAQNGSPIDVRYNPQTSRALYIYLY